MWLISIEILTYELPIKGKFSRFQVFIPLFDGMTNLARVVKKLDDDPGVLAVVFQGNHPHDVRSILPG